MQILLGKNFFGCVLEIQRLSHYTKYEADYRYWIKAAFFSFTLAVVSIRPHMEMPPFLSHIR